MTVHGITHHFEASDGREYLFDGEALYVRTWYTFDDRDKLPVNLIWEWRYRWERVFIPPEDASLFIYNNSSFANYLRGIDE